MNIWWGGITEYELVTELNSELKLFIPDSSVVSGNEMSVSPGRRFMIDLLVSSLMADGGLESALNAAITAEIQVHATASLDPNRPLFILACKGLHLFKQCAT